jgi:hypothetical protein
VVFEKKENEKVNQKSAREFVKKMVKNIDFQALRVLAKNLSPEMKHIILRRI